DPRLPGNVMDCFSAHICATSSGCTGDHIGAGFEPDVGHAQAELSSGVELDCAGDRLPVGEATQGDSQMSPLARASAGEGAGEIDRAATAGSALQPQCYVCSRRLVDSVVKPQGQLSVGFALHADRHTGGQANGGGRSAAPSDLPRI